MQLWEPAWDQWRTTATLINLDYFFQVKENDVALIQLKSHVPKDGALQPICLPPDIEDMTNPDKDQINTLVMDMDCQVRKSAWPEWPDLAKFRHFGKILTYFSNL